MIFNGPAFSDHRRILRLLCCFLSALAVIPAWADTFSFRGNRMETVLIDGKQRIMLSGGARIDSEDRTIQASEIELYGENYMFALCRGNVRIVDRARKIELTSDELFYNRKEKITRVRGNAVMVDSENEVVIKGGLIEDWEKKSETLIQIGVRILKKDLVCRSELAWYRRDKDNLELSGMPFIRWKGDDYQATKIYVDLENDRVRLEGDIQGKVIQTSDEEEKKDEGSEPKPAE